MDRRLVVLLALPLALAGCLRDFDGPSANFLNVAKIDVSAPVVTSGRVTLNVTTTLDNADADSGDVVVRVKAYDTQTSLLVVQNETAVGVIGKDKTVEVETRLVVPRGPGYRLDLAVLQDGQLAQAGSLAVYNLGGLEPNARTTGLAISTLDFLVQNVTDRVQIQANVYVTNEGASAQQELRMQVKAREVTTGLLSDEEWSTVAGVSPEETRVFAVNLTVPQRYNYEVEVVLWDGHFVVERGRGNVQLLPTFTKPKDEEIVVSQPTITDFLQGRTFDLRGDRSASASFDESYKPGGATGGYWLPGRSTGEPGMDGHAQPAVPGPGALLAVLAVAAALVLARRRS